MMFPGTLHESEYKTKGDDNMTNLTDECKNSEDENYKYAIKLLVQVNDCFNSFGHEGRSNWDDIWTIQLLDEIEKFLKDKEDNNERQI